LCLAMSPHGEPRGEPPGEPPPLNPDTTTATTQPTPINSTPPTTHTAARLPTPLSPPPSTTPSLLRRFPGAARRGIEVQHQSPSVLVRPGVELQDHFLRNFYNPIVTGYFLSTPASVWITPPLPSPSFNLHFVRNSVNFLLTSFPSRLGVVQVDPWVFRVKVSSQNVANALVVRGSLRLASSVLLIHHSLLEARRATMAQCFQISGVAGAVAVNAAPHAELDCNVVNSECSSVSRLGAPGMSGLKAQYLSRAAARSEAKDTPAPAMHASLPKGLTAITATQQPAIPSYLKALQSPAKAAHQQPKPPQPITAKAVCYRCLSPEHLVRACRDPVRCRNCRGYGHRSHDCKMPISQTLSPASHHRKTPTIPVPASRLPVHAVPFNYPAAKASSSTPPTPPSSPATQTYLDAYAPKNMLASSSSCPPDFMLPSAGASKATCMEGPLGLGRAALPKAHCSSPPRRMVDICIDSRNGKAPVEPVFAPSRSPSLGRRSPPSGPGSPVPRSGSPPSWTGSATGNDSGSFPEPDLAIPVQSPSLDLGGDQK
jgi:hypothetical protein